MRFFAIAAGEWCGAAPERFARAIAAVPATTILAFEAASVSATCAGRHSSQTCSALCCAIATPQRWHANGSRPGRPCVLVASAASRMRSAPERRGRLVKAIAVVTLTGRCAGRFGASNARRAGNVVASRIWTTWETAKATAFVNDTLRASSNAKAGASLTSPAESSTASLCENLRLAIVSRTNRSASGRNASRTSSANDWRPRRYG